MQLSGKNRCKGRKHEEVLPVTQRPFGTETSTRGPDTRTHYNRIYI